MAKPVSLSFMDIQPNWDEVLRLSRCSNLNNAMHSNASRRSNLGRNVWVSCRQHGKSEHSNLTKSANGKLQGEAGGNFVVTSNTQRSVTVQHTKADLTTTFVSPRKHLQLHQKQLLCMDISQSGGLGVCSSEDGELWVWETDTGESRRNLEGHVGDVYSCRFFPSGVVILSGGSDLRLKIWSAEDGSCVRTFTGHTRGITDTAIIDRGRNFISVSSDGSGRLWDCGSGRCLDTLISTGTPINSCALIANSSLSEGNGAPPQEPECGTEDKLLLVACEDGSLRCCDIRNRNTVMVYRETRSPLSACTFLDSCHVMSGADDGTLAILDTRKPSSPLNIFQFCESPVKAVLPECGSKSLAGFRNGSCILWTSSLAQEFHQLTSLCGPEADPVTSVRKSSGSVYTSCRDGSVRAYSVADLS